MSEIPEGYIIVPASAWHELVQYELRCQELAAQVEALRAGLNQAIELLATALVEPQQITEAEIYDLRQIEQAAPQQHLAEIRAQAGRAGYAEGYENGYQAGRVGASNRGRGESSDYADSIRQEGEVE